MRRTIHARSLAGALAIALAAVLGLGTSAHAAGQNANQLAPAASTGAASGITPTVASLAGTVNPNGVPTSYTFEYGPTLSFGQISPVASAGAGSTDVPVTATVTGLTANTTYYYRLVATSTAGTGFGAVAAVRSAPAAAVPGSMPDSPTQTNGVVTAIAGTGDRTYIGGSFTRVGVPIGFGASLAPASGAPDYSVAKPNGYVYAVASDGAGGWYIGGTFTKVGDIPRSRLAHLLADGSVDPAFDPTMGSHLIGPRGSDVRVLLLDGTTLYAGGDFTSVGAGANKVTRNFLAAIDVTTGLPTSFDAGLTRNSESQWVSALAVSGNRLWAGGTLFANPLYHNLVVVDKTTGAVDPLSEHVSVLPIYPQVLAARGGKLYIGGPFTSVNGVTRNHLAAINVADGSLDTAFDPNLNSTVTSIQFYNGKLYAGGGFTLVNGTVSRNGLAAFDPATGTVDPAFDPSVTGSYGDVTPIVTATALSGSTLYVAGNFSTLKSNVTRHNLAAVDLSTGAVTAFDPNVDLPSLAIAATASRVYAGGYFSFAGTDSIASGVAALKPDGTLDQAFQANLNAPAPVSALAVSAGKVYVGAQGGISAGGPSRPGLAALDATTGALVTSFDAKLNGFVSALLVAGDKLYVGGSFTSVGGGALTRNRLAALDPTSGVADATFNPNMSNDVFALALSGTRLYAAGRFTTVNGSTARNGLAAVDATSGAVDAGFTPGVATDINALAVAGGALYAGGGFTTINGAARGRLAALDAATATPTAFAPNVQGTVHALSVAGGTLYAGGIFSAVNGVPYSRMAAIDMATGVADPRFAPIVDSNVSGTVSALLASGARLYAGGTFNDVSGRLQMSLARFSAPAQPVPVAVTGASSAVTSTTVVVAGQVNPSGQPAAYTFEYGTSPAFGSISSVVALDDADALEPVNASLSGLTPGTTYFYRVVATNASGTTMGAVSSFTTAGGALTPLATTGLASAVTATGATLTGTVDARGSATAFAFEYGPTNDFGSLSAIDSAGSSSGSQAVSLPISGLTPGTEYRYRIIATNANGTTAGAVQSFRTASGT